MSDSLYHYCPAETFWKIIEKRTLRVSSVLNSNDFAEGLLLQDLLREKLLTDPVNCEKADYVGGLVCLIRNQIGGRAFCLTEERDLLSQWCRYADDGRGYAIRFSRSYLKSIDDTDLVRVEYDSSEHVKVVDGLYAALKQEDKIHEHAEVVCQAAGIDQWDPFHSESRDSGGRGNAYDFRQRLLSINIETSLLRSDIFQLKHNGFREEREHRLLDRNLKNKERYRDITMHLEQDPILEVMLGPTNDSSGNDVERMLGKAGFVGVKVCKSNIPYRHKLGSENMKLSKCILAFEKGISESNRPEDRNLAGTYLSVLAPLLAKVIEQQPWRDDIENIERLMDQTWIIDVDPFKKAFDLWEKTKKELN